MEQNVESKETQADKATFFYTLARIFAFIVLHVFCPVRYHHMEAIQNEQAPFIAISNHRSWMDPLVVAMPCKKYEIHFLGKKELAKGKILQYVTQKLHMISIGRHESDIQAMRLCSKVLKQGHVLGIFPEGTRHQKEMMQEVETGVAVLALRGRVPLVPVYIDGKVRLFHVTHAYGGEPMDITDLCDEGTDMQTAEKLAERIRTTFYAMREQARKDGNASHDQ